MKTLALCILLIGAPVFAEDRQHVLPQTPVTIHGTMSVWDAYQATAKALGVKLLAPVIFTAAETPKPDQDWHVAYKQQLDELRNRSIALNLDNATGEEALDAITAFTHMQWSASPSCPENLDKSKPIFVSVYAK